VQGNYYNHKTYKTLKTMFNLNEKCVAAPNRVAAGKRAGWPLSPAKESGFICFVGFVIRNN
jgi:hypothetical protein